MEWITWEVVVAVLGGIMTISTTFFLYLSKMRSIKRNEKVELEEKIKKIQEDLTDVINHVNELLDKSRNNLLVHSNLNRDILELKKELESLKRDSQKADSDLKENIYSRLDALDKRVEKFTEILMKFISYRAND